jgi:hypothetical protein
MSAGYFINTYRASLRAMLWHFRHGDSMVVADHRVKVPPKWYVEQDSTSEARLWNSVTGETVLFQKQHPTTAHLEYWSELTERLSSPKSHVTGRRTIQVGDGSMLCLEEDREPIKTLHLSSAECRSTINLEAIFFGGMHRTPRADYAEFYSMVQTIQPTATPSSR